MDNRNSDIKNRNLSDRDDRDVNRAEFNRQDHDRDRVIENSRERNDYNTNEANRRLHFLGELSDYKVVREDPDVRGWDVVDVNNRKVGKIDDLLVDIRREKVRYLDVDLDQEILHKDHDPLDNTNVQGVHEYKRNGDVHMIVPIGLARIDEENKRVISDDINRNILESGHVHRKGDIITPQHERNIIDCIECNDMDQNRMSSGMNEQRNMGTAGTMGNSMVSERREMRRPDDRYDTDLSRPANLENDERRSDRDIWNEPENRDVWNDTDINREENRIRDTRDINDREPRERARRMEGRGMANERMERRATSDPQTQGPINDDFYSKRYFDERRFFGRS